MSKFLSLFLIGCATLRTPPPAAADAVCLGLAGVNTATNIVAQAGENALPAVDLDFSQCINFPPVPATCEDIAKLEAWIEWIEGAEIVDGEAHLIIPRVEIAECPAL